MNIRVSPVKVLVVDSQSSVVATLCAFLDSNGYQCIPCESSVSAMRRFVEDERIGLVVCDLHMADLNGIELLHELKRIGGKQRALEAIMTTDRATKQEVVHALREGFADYYRKPLDLQELLEGLQRQEQALQGRQRSYQYLGQLNEKLQFLAESINDLYQDLERARHPRGGAGGTWPEPGEAVPEIFDKLSPRQLDVARLVGKGQTNYQIACELGITENTVKLYVSQVLRLTKMHNRTQLALALSPRVSRLPAAEY